MSVEFRRIYQDKDISGYLSDTFDTKNPHHTISFIHNGDDISVVFTIPVSIIDGRPFCGHCYTFTSDMAKAIFETILEQRDMIIGIYKNSCSICRYPEEWKNTHHWLISLDAMDGLKKTCTFCTMNLMD